MTDDREFWGLMRRGLLFMVLAVEQRWGFSPRCPYKCEGCRSGELSVVNSAQRQETKKPRFLGQN